MVGGGGTSWDGGLVLVRYRWAMAGRIDDSDDGAVSNTRLIKAPPINHLSSSWMCGLFTHSMQE